MEKIENTFFHLQDWPALLTRTATCAYLSMSKDQLRLLIADGTLKPVVLPNNQRGDLYFKKYELDKFIEKLPLASSSRAVRKRQDRMKTILAGRLSAISEVQQLAGTEVTER